MRSILYWSLLILVAILLAYISPFNLAPLVFLAGGFLLALGSLAFSGNRRRKSGVRERGVNQTRFIGSILVYVMTFWTTIGMFSNVKEHREFWARYEPYVQEGTRRGYTFFYLDHAGNYERIDSPELNQLLTERNPEKVRMVLEVVKDFGKLRAYSVQTVESIAVDKYWTDGNPPWDVLRSSPQ